MNECLRSRMNVSPNMRCIENRASGANRAFRRIEPMDSYGYQRRWR